MPTHLTEQAVSKRFRLDELLPDAENRRLREWKVEQISKQFDFNKWTPPVVRESGNCVGPTIVEGHHRIAAACKRGLGKVEVICYTHPAPEEDRVVGEMYIGINDTLASTPTEKFVMRLRAEDPTAVAVAALIEAAGFEAAGFEAITEKPADNSMHVPTACEWVYRGGMFRKKTGDTPQALVFALSALRSTYGKEAKVIRPEMIRGFGTFAHRYPDIAVKAVTSKVHARHPRFSDLLKDSKTMAEALRCEAAKATALVIRQDYNVNRKAQHHLDEW